MTARQPTPGLSPAGQSGGRRLFTLIRRILVGGVVAGGSGCAPTFTAAPGAGPLRLQAPVAGVGAPGSSPPCVADVTNELASIERRGGVLGFHVATASDLGGYRRHWQGIQRASVENTPYLLVSRSGGSTAVDIVRLGSRRDTSARLAPPSGARGSDAPPPESDRVVAWIPYDSGFDHAGGLSLLGTFLAIPMDGDGRSAVIFYDIANIHQPRRLGALRRNDMPVRSDPGDASAVGLLRLADGRYLMVVGVHSSKALEFYVSTGTGIAADSSFRLIGTRTGQDVRGFQSLTLIGQCDGAIHLVGAHNTAIPPPSRGRNHLHWYRLVTVGGMSIALIKEGEQWLQPRLGNFGAGAGLFRTPSGRILVYATEFWAQRGGWVAVEEFGGADSLASRGPHPNSSASSAP